MTPESRKGDIHVLSHRVGVFRHTPHASCLMPHGNHMGSGVCSEVGWASPTNASWWAMPAMPTLQAGDAVTQSQRGVIGHRCGRSRVAEGRLGAGGGCAVLIRRIDRNQRRTARVAPRGMILHVPNRGVVRGERFSGRATEIPSDVGTPNNAAARLACRRRIPGGGNHRSRPATDRERTCLDPASAPSFPARNC